MRLHYVCRHCGQEIDHFDLPEMDEARIGLHVLSPEERSEMVFADPDGQQMTVHIVCDECVKPVAASRIVH